MSELATGDERIVLSARKTRYDLRVSLSLLLAGLVLTAVYFILGTVVYAKNPTSTAVLAFSILGNVGLGLVGVGALFAVINWVLLRQRESRLAPPPPRLS